MTTPRAATCLKLQAIRIGDLAIGTIPNEVYGSTGLNIKKDSPVKTTFVIELANGCEGYLPPPDLLKLGGRSQSDTQRLDRFESKKQSGRALTRYSVLKACTPSQPASY